MNFTNEGDLIIMTLMIILISSWTAIAAAPRFDLCQDQHKYDTNVGVLYRTSN